MTKNEGAAVLRRCIAALNTALAACESDEYIASAPNLVIETVNGTVTIRRDEDVIVQPNRKMVKGVSDSIGRKSHDFSMMAQEGGQKCPACGGSGRM